MLERFRFLNNINFLPLDFGYMNNFDIIVSQRDISLFQGLCVEDQRNYI